MAEEKSLVAPDQSPKWYRATPRPQKASGSLAEALRASENFCRDINQSDRYPASIPSQNHW